MTRPLEGVSVVDLSGMSGSYGTRLLAALGADVVKVEPPSGSELRRLGPFLPGVTEPEASLWWAYLAMGTRSAVVDLGDSADRQRLARLLAEADIVVDDHGPDVLDGYQLGYVATSAGNPGVVWLSITPFGLTGPKRHWRTSNLAAWASSGILYTVGFADQPPVVPGGPAQLALHATALNGAIGSMMGLRARRSTGRGQLIDLSVQEAVLALSPEVGVPVFLDDKVHRVRAGNRRTLSRPFGLYPCVDGYVSILVLMPRHWDQMAEWLHEATDNEAVMDPVFKDMAVRGETMELIDGWTEELTTSMSMLDFFREAQARGIPVTPVNTIEALRTDPHLAYTGYWSETQLPAGGTITVPGMPFRMPVGWLAAARAPRLGEHTDEVFARQS